MATSEPLRWMTCAPRDYPGDERYFSRDTGLLCLGLREAGVECQAILCGDPRPGDHPALIRATPAELEQPAWWRQRGVGAVVIHTWSRRENTAILRAVREAGCRVILLQDGSGITGPLGRWWHWVRESWYLRHRQGRRGLAWFAARMLQGHTLRLLDFERERAAQFELADLVLAPSPGAAEAYSVLAARYDRGRGAAKVQLLPHPVSSSFGSDGNPLKEDRIVAVGRWDDFWQKRPDLLGQALERCLERHPSWKAEIFGSPGSLEAWHQQLPASLQSRVLLAGQVANSQLAVAMARAKILLCSSAYESFHIASAEALCSGASVAGFDTPMAPSLRWFASEHSGTLSSRFDAVGLTDACDREIAAWNAGQRNPANISRIWRARLQAVEVARSLLAMAAR